MPWANIRPKNVLINQNTHWKRWQSKKSLKIGQFLLKIDKGQ